MAVRDCKFIDTCKCLCEAKITCRYGGPLPSDSTALRNQKTNALAQLSSLYETVNVNQAVQDSLQNSYADSILTRNGMIYIGTLHEDNERLLNEIYANWLKTGELDALQVISLEGIIYQCPKLGGTAVYGARALYATINDKVLYDDVAECNAQNISWRTTKPPTQLTEEVKLYPNPSNDEVNLVFSELHPNLKLLLHNALGQVVRELVYIHNTSKHFVINVNDLPKGVYCLQIQGDALKTIKLIVE